ncbi:putative hydrolase or acyltransferase of alpha/beta superfamily [Desulfocapsa sulfexigens DSM 10523]|uniref:Putative hydrolase or acyltransferase of alpha/beta superfamily n=1 Tax=Desulfocapsa sulfexigens (strain DSM 10523 / SB164P1) TaxID=1167006 RepID=M1NZD4_DESSD|nr:alpha/beta hydrolase [Desulfocapsa sulfexigens]AGF76608.1 putative hydrolase or acyltransferase of alpha/beta superfamily [Desulfocapsa sulfexigens DSM 10523]
MQPIKNETIAVNGSPINILMAGDHSQTPLLFLHGKAFQAETWQQLGTIQAAIDAGFPILALDFPGFGKSPESDTTPETVINGVLEATGIKSIIMVAPSMSGKIAIEYALANPHRIAGLVLIGAVGVQENRENLCKLPPRTLLIWGENDQISAPANGALLNREIPGSEFVIFKNAPHPCYLEQPAFWHDTLLNFAQKVTKQN